jgi:DNA-binding CsgD family transcriptional regulator
MSVLAGIAGELLERDAELRRLAEARSDVTRLRRGRVVFVGGEAGIGKTALLRRFCEDAGRVLWAACDPLFTPRPLGPLLDLDAGPALRAQLDAGGAPHDVAAALLDELDRARPVVLVLEDLHWGDEATFDVVRLVARRIERVAALLVISYRDEQVHRSHPLRLLLGEVGAATRLELEGLSAAAVARLAEPAGLDATTLHARTAGNPFFLTEAIAAGNALPETVRDAVLARAARLTLPARDLLDAIAIVPQAVEPWLLEALIQLPPGALDECLASGMLRTDGDALAFRHELARQAIEESLAPDRRVALHRLALAALGDPPFGKRDLARLAHHAEAAGDGRAVLRHAPAAAEAASRLGAHREAQAQYGRALRFAGGLAAEARADLLMKFGQEGFVTDMRDEAVAALGEAIELRRTAGAPEPLADALLLRARMLACAATRVEAAADTDEAVAVLEAAPESPALAQTYALKTAWAMMVDDVAEARRWSDRAVTVAERMGDTDALVRALNYCGATELRNGLAEGRAKLERSIAIADEHELHTAVGLGFINLCSALGDRWRWPEADPLLAAGVDYCRQHGLEAWTNCLVGKQAESALAQGRWTEAADLAVAILERTADGMHEDRFSADIALAGVRARRGDPEVRPLLEAAAEMAQGFEELTFLKRVAVARAEAAWLAGQPDRVVPATDAVLALALERGLDESAAELACWQRRAGRAVRVPVSQGPFGLLLAGDHRGAAEGLRAVGCDYDAALALADSDTEADLREALEILQELGARPAAQILSRRLRERGARDVPKGPRPSTKANPAGLTARELEVLALIAEGLRNADIAERLVLSKKTVGHHVSNVLRKLGVASRGQAAALAAREGLLA